MHKLQHRESSVKMELFVIFGNVFIAEIIIRFVLLLVCTILLYNTIDSVR